MDWQQRIVGDMNGMESMRKHWSGGKGIEMAKYKAMPNTGFQDKDARIIGAFIDENFPDGVNPKELVEAARPNKSPIHDYFNWDDKEAAEQYRLQQARKLISCVIVVVDEQPIRAWHSVRVNDGRRYMDLKTVRSNEDLWEQILSEALREVKIWEAKYRTYKQLSPVFQGIRKAERKIAI